MAKLDLHKVKDGVRIVPEHPNVRKADEPGGLPQSSSSFKNSWAARREVSLSERLAPAIREVSGNIQNYTAAEALEIETSRLLRAFRAAEGRDPGPDGDLEFWSAYAQIFALRSERHQDLSDATPVRKTKDEKELVEKLRKALNDDSTPRWLKSVIEGS